MADLTDDISWYVTFTRRGDTHRLVILNIYSGLPPGDHPPIAGNHISGADLVAQLGDSGIDGDPSRLDQSIGFAPRADAVLGEELVDADLIHNPMEDYCAGCS